MVIPSIPGYGYSAKPRETGWGPARIARAWTELMKRLGYTRYVAQGGDWGAIITDVMATQEPPGLLAMHTNFGQALFPPMSQQRWRVTCWGLVARRHRACPLRRAARTSS